ncbi:hypothetical protein NFJ02_39g98610 [Pycnococcus provasolii]
MCNHHTVVYSPRYPPAPPYLYPRDADDDDDVARFNAKRDVVFVAKATLYAATALLITLVILPQAIAKYT